MEIHQFNTNILNILQFAGNKKKPYNGERIYLQSVISLIQGKVNFGRNSSKKL